ncbi:MAG: EAL domain-containing protein [Propionivibrio sp.]
MSARLPVNLMLVEDERVVAFDLKRQLSGFGYHVGAVVASGEQAIRRAEEVKPDLVLMDIHLEGRMDGIEAAAEIRSRHRVPVVFLTAYAEDDTLGRALDSRPFGYLVKPCEGRELHATIQMALARHEDEMFIQESEERLQLALDAGSLGVLEWDPATNKLKGDVHLGLFFGNRLLPLDETSDTFLSRVDKADRERVRAALDATAAGSKVMPVEFRTVGNHLPARYMEARVKAYGAGKAGGRIVGILQDVTQRHRDEERLRQSSVVFHTSAEAIAIIDTARRVAAVNPAFSRITGFAEEEVIGLDLNLLLRVNPGPEHEISTLGDGEGGYWHGEVRCYRKTGEAFRAWQSIGVVRNAEGVLTHYVMAFSDVTAIYEAQQQLHHLAHHDPLTGLPNRLLFDNRLNYAIEQGVRNNQRCLLLFLDLDGFKVINDTLGHVAGDELLRIVGARLKGVLRASDTVARLGDDEFVILAGSTNPDYAAQLAQKILEQLRLPIPLSGHMLAVSASLGIAVFPEHGVDSQQLMRAADMAMYAAKAEGRNRYQFYAEDMSARTGERMHVEQGLRQAIANDGLAVYYQPRVDLEGRNIVGAEALVRWPHPERGMVSPDSFIAIAEESGIIEHLGQWVLRRACSEMLGLERHIRESGGQFHLAVNVSARQFMGTDFIDTVRSVLEETGFPPTSLELEITESCLQTTERSLALLKALDAIGVTVSIDDFGTGYSSLSVLRDLPVHRVKIDRSFIVDLKSSESQQAMVKAIVALSRIMHMSITVEGIESLEQADLLQELGCHQGQGYHFGQPMASGDFLQLIES